MAKRRRANVSWLPIYGTELGQNANSFRVIELNMGVAFTHTLGIIPLTFDYPRDPSLSTVQDTSLADFVGSAYLLRRIVGKCFVDYITVEGQPEAVMVAGAFFVARADPINPDLPVGAATSDEAYDPLLDDTMTEPWIWRRTWRLDSNLVITNPTNGLYATNRAMGSAVDGPHIDAQTMRRVQDDERLWFVLSATSLFAGSEGAEVSCVLDYRLLGSLRKNKNRSAF